MAVYLKCFIAKRHPTTGRLSLASRNIMVHKQDSNCRRVAVGRFYLVVSNCRVWDVMPVKLQNCQFHWVLRGTLSILPILITLSVQWIPIWSLKYCRKPCRWLVRCLLIVKRNTGWIANKVVKYRWFSARLQCLQCVSNGDAAVLH